MTSNSAEYPGALWIPSPHFGYGEGATNQNTCTWIICHGTAGFTTAQDVGYFFQINNPPTSVHYVVGQDGTVVQCVQERNAAWGNGAVTTGHAPWWNPNNNPNLHTISIEHVKPDPTNQIPLTQAQQEASFKLIAYLCHKYNIPARAADANGGITGHFSIDPVNRAFCPGTYPWDALWTYLNQGPTMLTIQEVSNYYEEVDAAHWKCKQTGFVIADGLLQFYCAAPAAGTLAGLTAYGLPLENENYPKPGVAVQHFERGCLVYDPNHLFDNVPGAQGPVYMGHVPLQSPPAPSNINVAELKTLTGNVASATNALEQFVQGIPS